jgi:gas vesicle protein
MVTIVSKPTDTSNIAKASTDTAGAAADSVMFSFNTTLAGKNFFLEGFPHYIVLPAVAALFILRFGYRAYRFATKATERKGINLAELAVWGAALPLILFAIPVFTLSIAALVPIAACCFAGAIGLFSAHGAFRTIRAGIKSFRAFRKARKLQKQAGAIRQQSERGELLSNKTKLEFKASVAREKGKAYRKEAIVSGAHTAVGSTLLVGVGVLFIAGITSPIGMAITAGSVVVATAAAATYGAFQVKKLIKNKFKAWKASRESKAIEMTELPKKTITIAPNKTTSHQIIKALLTEEIQEKIDKLQEQVKNETAKKSRGFGKFRANHGLFWSENKKRDAKIKAYQQMQVKLENDNPISSIRLSNRAQQSFFNDVSGPQDTLNEINLAQAQATA